MEILTLFFPKMSIPAHPPTDQPSPPLPPALLRINASINVKPEGGGWAYVGYLTPIVFPTLGNLT